jgi:hypothetical protein
MPDDIDRSIWSNLLLNSLLKKCDERMWEAIHTGKDVALDIDGRRVAEFSCEQGHVRVDIDGLRVADVDVTPARYEP